MPNRARLPHAAERRSESASAGIGVNEPTETRDGQQDNQHFSFNDYRDDYGLYEDASKDGDDVFFDARLCGPKTEDMAADKESTLETESVLKLVKQEQEQQQRKEEDKEEEELTFWEEARRLFILAWPIALSSFLQLLSSLVLLIFIGHYQNTINLDVVGLGTSFANVFGLALGQGLASAGDTLSSQAWGSPNKKVVGIVLQRGMAILGLTSILTSCLWINAQPILLVLHQDPKVAILTGKYVLYSLPTLPLSFLVVLLQKYLQAQSIVRPIFYIGLLSNVTNVLFCYLFIGVFKWGILGAALTQDLMYVVVAIGTIGYIYFSKCYVKTWPGWTKEAFADWRSYLKLGIPGMFMLCVEWWSFEIGQFLAGLMGEVSLASQLIVLQLASLSYRLPYGIGIAASVRVGNLLGSNQPKEARRAAYISLLMGLCTGLLTAVFFASMRQEIPEAFSSDHRVISRTAAVMVIVSVFTMFDHAQGIFCGILRGCGMQFFGAVFNVIGYYAIGLPIMVVAAFVLHFDVRGLWLGLLCAVAIQVTASYCKVFWFTNWQREAGLARSRVGSESHQAMSPEEEPLLASTVQPKETQWYASYSPGENTRQARSGLDHTLIQCHLTQEPKPVMKNEETSTEDDFTLQNNPWGQTWQPSHQNVQHWSYNENKMPRHRSLRSKKQHHYRLPTNIKRSRVWWVISSIILLVVGIAVRLVLPQPIICYPLPDVSNATSTCDSFASLLAGTSCSATCDPGFELVGAFNCSSNGTLLSTPSCLQPPLP